jgi:acetoin utilization protein AcuB
MDVSDLMTREVLTVSPTDTVRDAITRLEDQHIRHLPVVDDGRLVGIVTDRDLREYRMPLSEALANPDDAQARLDIPVAEVMRGEPITVEPGETVRTAIDLMLTYDIGAVPVVASEDGRLLGILSYVDLRAVRASM